MLDFIVLKKKRYLRNDADPDDIFIRAIFEYCALARALCAAAVSTAETLRRPAE